MSDILIRGMEMPKWCRSCPFYAYDGDMDYYCLISSDNEPCPLVQLPPHGRLGDLDALFEKMYHLSDNEGAHKDSHVDNALILRDSACYLIEDAPTIVPAEGVTDNG
jgi:hypothetical protein